VPLFAQSDGRWEGLLPVSATDEPGTIAVEFLGPQQQALESASFVVIDAHFPIQNVNLAPGVAKLRNTPEEVQTLKSFRDNVTDTRFWTEQFLEPVSGCMVSPYGVQRYRNHKPTGDFHGGVDLRSPEGTPVKAASDGVVRIAQHITVLGNAVGLDHGQGVETLYMHMSRLAVEPGTHVKQGEVVGYVGTTGRSSGPHLHWSVYVDSVAVNPAQWTKLASCSQPPVGKNQGQTKHR
jgi:murein DD-endopeptidase MepM/ murein hydrolase activator NlpD